MATEQEGINLGEMAMNTEEGIELPVVDNDGNVDDVENDTTDSNQDNQDMVDSSSSQEPEDDEKINLQKGVNYERKLRKAAEKENRELKEQIAELTKNSNTTPEKTTIDELIESGVDANIAKSISAAINKKDKNSEQMKKKIADMEFKLELSEKSKESEFSDILEHEDEIKPLVDKGLTIEQAYYAVNHNSVQNTNRDIERKVEAKLQNNQTRKEILGNINSNTGNAVKSADSKPKATAAEIAAAKMAGIDINDYLAAKNAESINQYNDYNNRKVK